MNKRYFKIFLALALVAVMALSLFSCGQSAPANLSSQLYEGKTADGTTTTFKWDYDSKTNTLTVTGSGDMPNATSASGVAWAKIRSYVKTVTFVNQNNVPITSIGDYAFYGMSNLKAIELPDGITSLGKLSFGFCKSLESITFKKNLDTVGESAFEGCTALAGITLPTSVKAVGSRAFAFCKSLKSVVIAGNVETIGHWTFKDCAVLATLKLRDSFKKENISATAFDGCGNMNAEKISYITLAENGKVNVTVKYVDSANNTIQEQKVIPYDFGESYIIKADTISGYGVTGESTKSGVATDSNIEIVFTYKSLSETAPSETTPDESAPTQNAQKNEGISAGTIIGIVIFVVVLAGLGIVIFILMRPSKDKNAKNAKNAKDAKGKNGKSKKK